MRKLSMKNAGMPDSEAEKPSGSCGVSADGEGARGPLRCARGAAPLAPGAGLPLSLERCWALEELCGRCERTRGAAPRGGSAGFGVGAGSTVSVGAVSVVWAGLLVVDAVSGAGLAALAVPGASASAARLTEGDASQSK